MRSGERAADQVLGLETSVFKPAARKPLAEVVPWNRW
jgi:hypothetical protein